MLDTENKRVYSGGMNTLTLNGGNIKSLSNGYFRLKGQELLDQRNTNLHRASHSGSFSYPTVHRYLNEPESVKAMSTRVLYGFLVEGLGIPLEELHDMRFGDIFEAVPDPRENGK